MSMAESKIFIKMLILLLGAFTLFIKPTSVLCASKIKCIEREGQALLKFKQGIVDEKGHLSSWGSGEGKRECCEWYGVECSNISGHVIRLDLEAPSSDYPPPSIALQGKISPTLVELQHLEHLNLGCNSLRVDSLEWLPHLSSLRYLDLRCNDLHETNNWLQQISKLSLLEELYLSECQLPNNLPAFDIFANSSMSSLQILDLSYTNLSSFTTFGSLFNSSTLLTQIKLDGNKFHGPIPDSFGTLNSLEFLGLNGNMFNEIPLSLGNLSHLRLLYLSDNEFNQPLDQIFKNLSGKASKSLEEIHLPYNQLVGSLSDIAQFSSLQGLGLRNNLLSGFDSQSLTGPSSLVFLDLALNKIGGSLPDLRAYSSLQELYLFENKINGMITEDHLSNLANLTVLDLSDNSLFLNISSNWSPPFQSRTLFLRDCNVGPAFPKWLQTQTTLKELDISSADISDELPTWLWNMPFLSYLNLSHNHISGRIPDRPSNSHLISDIDLSNNHLSGPIPLFLFHSSNLILSENKFSGSISHSCKAASNSNMCVLDLSNNQLTGELHDCWSNKTSLQIVNLSNNNLSGQIPPTFGNISWLQILHLRNNSFTGELPPSLKNCTQLQMLDLGRNKLTGTIPKWIGTHLTWLTVLSLRSNQFHGSIDTTICNLTTIKILDLSRNNLSGEIPKCFDSFNSLLQKNSTIDVISIPDHAFVIGFNEFYVDSLWVQWKGREYEYTKLGILKGIDLSNNKLVGTIPQEFSDLRGLIFLNLSRNHLTGNIMSNIGQMEMLEWLDLSRNELSGRIPNSLASLHFLSVLDLSYNNLLGKIPLGTQLQSFNSSTYAGNSQLCGLPLVECPWDSPNPSSIDRGEGNNVEEDDGLINRDFYICLTFGFITGFWIVVGTLFVKHSWRQSYSNFWDKIGDWMYVTLTIYAARFKRKFMA